MNTFYPSSYYLRLFLVSFEFSCTGCSTCVHHHHNHIKIYRVFHLKCVHMEVSPAEDWVCPECVLVMAAENLDTRYVSVSIVCIDDGNVLTFVFAQKLWKPRSWKFYHICIGAEMMEIPMISVNYFVTSAHDGNPSYQVSGDAPPQPRAAVHPSQARSCQVTFPFLKYLKYLDICSFLVIISHWIRATLKKKTFFPD